VAILPAAYLAWSGEATQLAPIIGIAAACVVAFWLVNMRFPRQKRARVFMGDSESLFLGFLICWFLADLSQSPQKAMTPVTALYLFAFPLMDTVFVMVRRWRNGLSPMSADRMHLHHLLLDLGFSPGAAAWLILGLAAGIAGVGLWGLFAGVPEYVMFYGFLGLFVVFYLTCNGLRRRIAREAWAE
jgi:UDP-GlcNAc:undecaprenyl-phosphate GlcNAc-1-phosphate transferase